MADNNINSSARAASGQIWSRYLVANMHCPSCVSHIEDVLNRLHPRPKFVSPSLVTSWVSVQHDIELSTHSIQETLEDAGFQICDVFPEDSAILEKQRSPADEGILDRALDRFRSSKGRHHQIQEHIKRCEVCQQTWNQKHGFSQSSLVKKGVINDLGTISSQQPDTALQVESEPKIEPLVVVQCTKSEDRWKASLAIGGMTCASCVNAVTEKLKEKKYVDRVAVNLISNSCAVEFRGQKNKYELVEAIEDIGYDAAIDSVSSLSTATTTKIETVREVSIMVDKMYCNHCPPRILSALQQCDDSLVVLKPLTLQDPILRIRYSPRVPVFTVRDILAKVLSADETFKPALFHPPSLEERSRKLHAREQRRLLIRVLLTIAIAIPTFIVGIVFMSLVPSSDAIRRFFMHPLHAGVSRSQWSLFILATPVYFLCADVFHRRALKELQSLWRRGSTTPVLQRFYRFGSMNMLMSLGTTLAYFSSVAQLINAGIHPSATPEDSSFYFDSVVFLTLFLLIGHLIESYSKSKTGDAVAMLGKLRPSEALLLDNSHASTSIGASTDFEPLCHVNVDLLELGDIVKVLNGGSPPCDGRIVKGEALFDESSLTGESRPVKKVVNDQVYAGTVNQGAPINVSITGVGGSSMLDQIVKAVREGQTRRAPVERIADTLTAYFVPFVTLIAVLTWIVWLSLGYSGALPQDYLGSDTGSWASWSIEFAIAVFVVACPCGLALAAPTALFVGGAIAAQNGILVKGGGEAFERASQLDCVVFDKTGTLTLGGEPVVTDFHICASEQEDQDEGPRGEKVVLGMIKTLESNSSHMVAKAIVSFCKGQEAQHVEVEKVEEVPGKGMKSSLDIESDTTVDLIIGNEAIIKEHAEQCLTPAVSSTLNGWKGAGKSIAIAVARYTTSSEKAQNHEWNNEFRLLALFGISDPIRPEARSIISALHHRNTQVYMLSGDNLITARSIGHELSISPDNIIADVLPSEKADKIRYLQRTLKARSGRQEHAHKRALIAMVGDGINDSPALSAADVGIAIGSGSDIAISSAEFVLVTSNLHALLTLLDLSKVVFRRIKFNFSWALVYNLVALPVAAGVLYPIRSGGNHIRLDPVWASLAMALSSISVVCSSLALRSKIPGVGFIKRKENEG